MVYVGAMESYMPHGVGTLGDTVIHCPGPGREGAIATSLRRFRTAGALPREDAASLRGRLLHRSDTYLDRIGRAQQ